jgi:cyclopropane fatty-acyl-phospholipid synthase-like methyltransferase
MPSNFVAMMKTSMIARLGPIKRHIRRMFMSPAQRRFELVGPPELWDMKRRFQIDFLRRVGLQPQHYLVDIGCGVLRGGVPIIDYLEPGHYYGIEARAYVLEQGRKELQGSGLAQKNPHLMHAEYLADVRLGRDFDYIWAFSVLIHLKDDILVQLMQFVAAHLGKQGVFYANVDTSDAPDAKWQEFPGVHRPLSFYAEHCQQLGLKMSDIGSLAEFGHITGGDADQQRMLEIRCA